MKKAISARIDEDVLQYIKSNGGKVNTLINQLLSGWMKSNQEKQILIFQEDTGTDELSQMKAKNNIKCSQCCNNCIHYKASTYWCEELQWCMKHRHIKTFCCIYWEHKKKGSN